MENYYHPQLSPQELQRRLSQQSNQQGRQTKQPQMQPGQMPMHGHRHMDAMGDTSMMTGMAGGESLDEIVNNNHSELHRRRSIPTAYNGGQMAQDDASRPMSMMDYDGNNNSQPQYRNYSFPGNMDNGYANMSGMANMGGPMASNMPNMQNGMGGNMSGNMNGGVSLSGGVMDSFSNHEVLQGMSSSDFSQFNADMMSNSMNMMPNTFANMNMGSMGPDATGHDMFANSPVTAQFPQTPLDPDCSDVTMDMNRQDDPVSAGLSTASNPRDPTTPVESANARQYASAENSASLAPQNQNHSPVLSRGPQTQRQPTPSHLSREVSTTSISPAHGSARSTPQTTLSGNAPSSATTPAGPQTPKPDLKEKSVYSKSGFDMLRALWYVATRKNPEIHLGAVDMSCAFVVCDVSLNDCPIIYVSDNFQNLTGYSRHEIAGQNCRFLQAPNGDVEAGTKREFVDEGAVYNLKKKIHEGKEVQQSLINYRKGGKPFLNLLTMIPIPWDDPNEIRYIVGFQIDLVECPDAIASGRELGGVQVNYKHSDIGQYIWTPPNSGQWDQDNGQTLGVDDVSTLLQQFNPKGVVSDWHKQSWDKMLLENTDDVVHVLSLKGLFLYLSPSCKKVLEYDAAELAGNSLSTVCHPSDIVPVTRELKETAAGNPVNIVFRIRRKNSGYTWFESHGSLFVEQGKGRKSIILVGRKRPVFALSRAHLDSHGGIGDSELWTKLSTSGMFLFVSSNIRSLLDLQPHDLVGTSIQELMRKESRAEFGRTIEKARRGKMVTCKHEVQNRRGQVLQAQTTLYPGDACEGQKPTFLLAQTKLLKASSRSIAPAATASDSPRSPGHVNAQGALQKNGGDGMQATHNTGASAPAGGALAPGSQDAALAADDNIFDELRTTKCSSWQFELRQMEKVNRILAEELGGLLSNKKKRKRRKGVGNVARDCANCHTRNTPEWRRGPSGQRDLCNSCGLRWAKQVRKSLHVNSETVSDGSGC